MREKLIKLREKANLTQEEVARQLGISRSFYGHIETGQRNPTYGLAKKIAKLFNVEVENIFFDAESYRMKQLDELSNKENPDRAAS
ncbi:MAG: helix-turn-helix transcriptional regulator [Thermoanaerobacteraceae bacterium]|nr:helix-turn-helix transcriptional regulator [Thermoanaerobacteraceae bacterium]